ncbi:MAG: hypothetical protein BGO23_00535 [Solirubrobacterales bacterium 67-14]|nr:MAG: hypothetical protein BGO23_00535 [Solirubrobacterales bacterium 67-14]
MVVALIALIVAIGGTATALPGKFTVGRDDLKNSSVGARALGKMIVGRSQVVRSADLVAGDGNFTETEGKILCPAKAPTALDPSIGNMGPHSFEMRRTALANRLGAPGGYRFVVSGDEGPDFGYTMTVSCLLSR